ncbi:hypothetical protein AC249_AIPGENE20273, partial [Exaiptasia diaphana]
EVQSHQKTKSRQDECHLLVRKPRLQMMKMVMVVVVVIVTNV